MRLMINGDRLSVNTLKEILCKCKKGKKNQTNPGFNNNTTLSKKMPAFAQLLSWFVADFMALC